MSVILETGRKLVIGHRGAAAVRPENTLPSFQHALELGVDAVEFDVRVTADGVAVVHHDPTTGRTCGDDLWIERSSIGALRKLDASSMFDGEFRPARRTPIPLLDEVLDLTRSMPVIIECKTVDAAPVVLEVLTAHGAQDRALVASFRHAALEPVRSASIGSGASRRDIIKLLMRSMIRFAPRRLPFNAMCIPEVSAGIALPIARFAAWGRALGIPVHVWTVNAEADARRLWSSGVTGIISDDPGSMLALRAAMRAG